MPINYKQVMHPEGYHGKPGKTPFFEGWYIKLIDYPGFHRYVVIPGISLSPGGNGPHSFIQVLDGSTGETEYHTYPLNTFKASRYEFNVKIGNSSFTSQGLSLDLPGEKIDIKGQIRFSQLKPWPVRWYSPGIMGWYAWVPFMECYHGVLSFDHEISGVLNINRTSKDFTGGRGYIEKDWGKSFPTGWVWMQSNHFNSTGTSFTASIAMIPWIKSRFRGFIVGLFHKNHLFRFATYTGAKTKHLKISSDTVVWILHDRFHNLEINARRAVFGDLKGPSYEDMAQRVPETIQAEISVKLSEIASGKVIFDDTGFHGGLEIAGDTHTLTHWES